MIARGFLIASSLASIADGFHTPPSFVTSARLRSESALSATEFSMMEPEIIEREDMNVTLNKVDIKRTWTYEGFQSYGDMTVDIITPDGDQKPRGTVFFMHGFSQYPKAYLATLKLIADEVNVAIVAVETGLTDQISRNETLAKGCIFDKQQYSLQRALSQDTRQCILMAMAGEEPFPTFCGSKEPTIGLAGHSMGGGLCFFVATEFENINYIFAMAPVAGVEEFAPSQAFTKRVVDNSMMLVGGWDFIACASKVKKMSATSNQDEPQSSLFGLIKCGLHTGFEDKIVLFNLGLGNVLGFIAIVFFGFWEYLLLKLLELLRVSTGQLGITRDLMAYFFDQMVDGKPATLEEAKEAVDPEYSQEITLEYPV